MEKFVECLLNIFDPPSPMEKRMERRWQIRLRKIQNEIKEKNSYERNKKV
jgi:hypothetical protein